MSNFFKVISIEIAILILMYAFRYQVINDSQGIFMNRWTGAIYAANGQHLGQVGNRR